MAKVFASLNDAHRAFIARQQVFFVASAAAGTRVNLSPKDVRSLRVLDANGVVYRDLTGSGNETAAHLLADGRLTVMFCAFEGPPLILRLYGRGRVLSLASAEGEALLRDAFDGEAPAGTRQLVRLDVDRVQTSCGFGVPRFDYVAERDNLERWAAAKGPAGIAAVRREQNAVSIDGLPTRPPAEAEKS
jgi:hypothetical protein